MEKHGFVETLHLGHADPHHRVTHHGSHRRDRAVRGGGAGRHTELSAHWRRRTFATLGSRGTRIGAVGVHGAGLGTWHAVGRGRHAVKRGRHAIGRRPHAIGRRPHAIGRRPHAIGRRPHASI